MNQHMLDQLRARLEHDEDGDLPATLTPVLPEPHPSHHTPTPEPLGAEQGGGGEGRTKRKKKRRRLKPEQGVLESSLGPEQESTQPSDSVEMIASTQPSDSIEMVAESEDQLTEIRDGVAELPGEGLSWGEGGGAGSVCLIMCMTCSRIFVSPSRSSCGIYIM